MPRTKSRVDKMSGRIRWVFVGTAISRRLGQNTSLEVGQNSQNVENQLGQQTLLYVTNLPKSLRANLSSLMRILPLLHGQPMLNEVMSLEHGYRPAGVTHFSCLT